MYRSLVLSDIIIINFIMQNVFFTKKIFKYMCHDVVNYFTNY